jgi:uncharacterized protein YqkB
MNVSASTTHEVPDTYTATLNGQLANVGFWDSEGPSCTIDGDGSYSLTYTYTGDDDILDESNVAIMLLLDFNTYTLGDGTTAEGTGIVLDVTSVTLGDTDMNYSGSCVAPSYAKADDGKTLKLNIYNVWSSSQYTQDITIPTDMAVQDGDALTVNFNVTGLDDAISRAKELNGITTTVTEDKKDDTIGESTGSTLSGEPTGIRGDVNYDGRVNVADVMLLKRYILRLITW